MKNNIILIAVVTILSLAIIITVILISTSGKENDDSGSIPTISFTEESDPPYPPDESTAESEPPSEEPPPVVRPDTAETDLPTENADEPAPSAGAAEVVALAQSLLGIDFVEGGDTPAGFDNSGFIYYVLRENGYITCPRGVSQQAAMGTALEYDQIKPGDLVFFYNESATGAGFGGIYAGGGKMIACLMPGTVVREVDITTDYYRSNFYQGVSLSG